MMAGPGESAKREYERRALKRSRRLDQKFGRFAGFVKLATNEPQSTRAFLEGSVGELRAARILEEKSGNKVRWLHDRAVRGTRGNIDHIAVSPCGVWVIDTKAWKGLIKLRDVGGLFRTDRRLYVGGRDRSANVEHMGWQVTAVLDAMARTQTPAVPVIHPALNIIGAEWGWFAKPFRVGDVLVAWPSKLGELVGAPGPWDDEAIRDVAERLGEALPAK